MIDAPVSQGAGTWTQVWHEYESTDTSQPSDDTTFQFSNSGVSVVSDVLRQEGISFTCTFSPPVEVADWPIAVGYSFSGAGSCGSFSISLKGSVTRTVQTTLGGTAVTAYVVDFTATTQGQVNSTTTDEEWLDPALRLDVHDAADTNGTYGPFKFQSNLTRDLVSGSPA